MAIFQLSRPCQLCGRTFLLRYSRQVFCSDECRFWSNIDTHGPVPAHRPELGHCWIWLGGYHEWGYGRFYLKVPGRSGMFGMRAHRWAYEQAIGAIPAGFDLDHLCRNPPCIRVSHLEAVSHRVNLLRGNGWAGRHARTTHCPQGHVYDEANTIMRNGRRKCRICVLTYDLGRPRWSKVQIARAARKREAG